MLVRIVNASQPHDPSTLLQVARIIGVAHQTIEGWEHNRRCIAPHNQRKIIRFLGYDPVSGDPSLSWRKASDLTQRQLVRKLQIDPSTLAKWKRGERKPTGELRTRLTAFLE